MWRYDETLNEEEVTLELTTSSSTIPLTIDVAETIEEKIERLISENPVIIFSRPSCYMCHVMKKLFSSLGVNPTVIELDEEEISVVMVPAAVVVHDDGGGGGSGGGGGGAPVVFIGGTRVGGLESLVALHVTGNLVPKLGEAGALRSRFNGNLLQV
ncbi:hypothetical protein AQUCO_00100051v1 [Aquilegia coerulea]|uniref:Glutaredoxin domain-containing protein n=1 Tax=Aquilegia coerulea TaxID=218851 RepID=A0A2G5F8H3_AQUCA|nr:hypothetical protein AQUCO_00100051v1 [Aquilegia coerulea]